MKDISNNFVTILGWMPTKLKLSGHRLTLYALIYGFTQDGSNKFTGSLKYLQNWMQCGRSTVINSLNDLVESGLIIKESEVANNITTNKYYVNLDVINKGGSNFKPVSNSGTKSESGGTNFKLGGGSNFKPNNTNIDIDSYIYNQDTQKNEDVEKPYGMEIDGEPYNTNTLNKHPFTTEHFLARWSAARKHYDKVPTNITRLKPKDRVLFENLKKDYTPEQFDQAIAGLFNQKTFPVTRVQPSHFLDNFELYLDCFHNKTQLYNDDKKPTKNGML